jgi:hypothetical protein
MKLIAYAGYQDPYDFKNYHLPEMQDRGFDAILFGVSESQWRYNLDNIREMREHAETSGMDIWAGPWGLSGMFAGEAVSSFTPDTDGQVAFELWKQDMTRKAGFGTIFLDEPKIDGDPDTLWRWFDQQRWTTNNGIKIATSLPDDTFRSMTDEQLRTLPVDSLGLSCYHWTDSKIKVIQRSSDWVDRLKRLRPNDCHVWVQLFDLPEDREWIPSTVKAVAELNGVNDHAYWSFRASNNVSSKSAFNWREVWDCV